MHHGGRSRAIWERQGERGEVTSLIRRRFKGPRNVDEMDTLELMGGEGRQIRRGPSLVDEIFVRLRSDIIAGKLIPGQRISAGAVGRELGVSHIPVREALRRLEAEALVESTRHHGAVVSSTSVEDVTQIYDLRRLIEGQTAARAAERYTDADVQTISDMGERLMAADPTDPSTGFWEKHRAFHRAVLEADLDPWRERVLGMLWQSAERYARLRTLVFDSPEDAISDHRAILAAALRRDPTLVSRALTNHLEKTQEIVLAGYRLVLRDEESAEPAGPTGGRTDGAPGPS